ncbi:oligosaccharide biosynthesis protein Alg14 [Mangrovibacterium diazotrophicum]|uniref:Oligosaccharide biosynthesis protein Alg14 n=2 Tax=Mangrovibacterium diazotrophicum TaxID=1261403 RepID=A0A419W9B6_9BACT|nr:oligosaccharide biosynthesis protein Alg14 [Mangrovibacterium diazotrophicum]
MAIASVGGHWIELLRLVPAFRNMEVIFISTNAKCASMVPNQKFYEIPDGSRWNSINLVGSLFKIIKIIKKEKPHFIISTGAAPGLMGIIAGKLMGCKTIWVESIANAEELSMSGRIASSFSTITYVQWPHLSNHKIKYKGDILS